MKYLAWLFRWSLRAAIFFALLAFALNNQHQVEVHFFLGQHWSAPLVAVLLGGFALGLVAGVLGMAPHWWRQRRLAKNSGTSGNTADTGLINASAARPDGH